MAAEADRGVSLRTWNDTLKLRRAAFQHRHPHVPVCVALTNRA
jgi:hypothetical protein